MEMVINGRFGTVINAYIEYDYHGKGFYYVIVECSVGIGALEKQCVKVTFNPSEAIKIRDDIRQAVDAKFKGGSEVDS